MTDSVSFAVVEALADAENVEPRDLDDTLEAHIDTDALAQLAAHETAVWTLSFEAFDHAVTVSSDELILIDGHKKGTWTGPKISASHD